MRYSLSLDLPETRKKRGITTIINLTVEFDFCFPNLVIQLVPFLYPRAFVTLFFVHPLLFLCFYLIPLDCFCYGQRSPVVNCTTCNYKVVGSNSTKLTADFTLTCAFHNHRQSMLYARDSLLPAWPLYPLVGVC